MDQFADGTTADYKVSLFNSSTSRKFTCAPFLVPSGNSRGCLASSPLNHGHVVWHPEPSSQDIPPWATRQATQVSVEVLGNPVQLELSKKQLATCGGGVGRGRGVGVGRGGTVTV